MPIDKAKACELASQGKTIQQICDILGISTRTLYETQYSDPIFAKDFTRARQEGLELHADSLINIADEADDILRARLKSENIRWLLSRRLPAQYGDKIALDVSGQIDLVGVLAEARQRLRPVSDQQEAIDVEARAVAGLPAPTATDSESATMPQRAEPSIWD